MRFDTWSWWLLMCAISALNISLWLVAALRHRRGPGRLPAAALRFRKLQLLLSAGYVFGCAYRSVMPVYDIQRLCLFDTWFSSVIVGRSVATVAELCFAAQWALLLRAAAQSAGSRLGLHVAAWLLPLIAVAEVCSWHAVLTTANLGHVIEETLWGASAALIVLGLGRVWSRSGRELRPLIAATCVVGAAYVLYMFAVDVPMYWARWLADELSGRPYLSVVQGLADASGRWVVSHHWAHWASEVVWMTLYFSVAVWISIGIAHAPAWATARPSAR
ncbi:MAG: hypothetical protein Q8K96_06285 [Rubrivivax sp.]|nr:hypothetical protein [Rubrivivax sp.]